MKWIGIYSLQLFLCKNTAHIYILAAALAVLVRMLDF